MREIFVKDSPQATPWRTGDTFPEPLIQYLDRDLEITNKKIVKQDLIGEVTHQSYGEYLKLAYNNDWGIVIQPDFIWYSVMSTFASYIKAEPDKYRKYFTKTRKKKIEIVVDGRPENGINYVDLPAQTMLDATIAVIPRLNSKETKERLASWGKVTDDSIRELMMPVLSTSTPESNFAIAAAFLEAASPYYSYGYIGCMYNKIKILGTKEDYEKLHRIANQWEFVIPELRDYWARVCKTLGRITNNWDDDEFWKRILWTEQGYMTQNLDGWFIDFLADKHPATYGGGFYVPMGNVTKVNYREVTRNLKYILISGLLSSKTEDGYLIPQYGRIIFSDTEYAAEPRADEKGNSLKHPIYGAYETKIK